MVVFPNCKINLGLRITRKRPDGYHDLETVFYPLPFYDSLEIIEAREKAESVFTTSGITVPGKASDNLCMKATALLKSDFPIIGSLQIHLHKAVPLGAGLGGGSADGAYTLLLLNKLFELDLSREKLIEYALRLGSDSPFFILNTACVATGRGEVLTPINLDLSTRTIVLVYPGIHVDTPSAFSGISPFERSGRLSDILVNPIEHWKNGLENDFEETVFSKHPEIGKIKTTLYESGALYASMSGSGSAVYGIFNSNQKPSLAFPKEYLVRTIDFK
ncbi:MAG: 4-(cytidine 5'-diphospho)-2-C-methyl-D-erythritol kinase [Chitinophagaceae bacterium]|nr:4-(cytidine 5'-diphospho)-2-C-methyl-D-erythritol kinase [Chitinophagaceae bacterium]